MPATIRIDFDVHSESISEALKAELAKVQGITTQANAAISAANSVRVNKDADEAIRATRKVADQEAAERMKAANERAKLHIAEEREAMKAAERSAREAQKAADREIKEAERAAKAKEKEEERVEKYLFNLRMKSINDANKAQEKADKEAAKAREAAERESSKPKEKHGISAGEAIGIGAAIEGFKMLKEHAKEADEANDALLAGLGATGLKGEELAKQQEARSKDAAKIADTYAISEEKIKEAMGKVAAFSGASGEKLTKMTEDAVILAQSTGQDIETVAKMMGKATDEEIAANATKIGVSLDKSMTAEQRAAKIHEEAEKRKKAVTEASNDSLGAMDRIMNKIMSSVAELSGRLLDALKPALDAIVPVVTIVGQLVGDVLKPVLDALAPIVSDVAKLFADLAPPITELVQGALSALMPVLKVVTDVMAQLMPVITDVVKTVVTSMSPVFKALVPIIQEVAGIVGELAQTYLKDYFVPVLNTLMPILTELFVPVLMSLMPLLKAVADITAGVLTPTMKIFGGIMNWLITNAIQPLVKWLSGTLSDALNAVVGTVTKVVGAISSIVNTVGSLLGLSDDKAPETVKDTGAKVAAAQAQSQAEIVKQSDDFSKAEIEALKLKAKRHQLTQAEINADKERAERNHNSVVLGILASAQSQATSQAKKAVKDAYDEAKKASDAQFELKKYSLLSQNLTEKAYKEESLKLQIDHDKELIAIAEKYKKDHLSISTSLINDTRALQKADFENEKADVEEHYKDMLDDVADDAKATYNINKIKFQELLQLAKDKGQETLQIQKQLDDLEKQERKRVNKEELDDAKAQLVALHDLDKARLDAMPAGAAKEIAQAKAKYEDDLRNYKDALAQKKLSQQEFDEYQRLAAQRQHNEIVEIHRKEAESIIESAKDANLFIAKSGAERVQAIKAFLLQELAHYVATKYAEVVATETTEAQKSAFTIAGVAQRVAAVAVGIASDIAAAAASAFDAVASAISSIMAIVPFPFSLALVPAAIASIYGLYSGAKALFGFEKGGFTGYGEKGEVAGTVHKNEYVLKSGSFGVDAFGNLVSVGGVGGGTHSIVGAINAQSDLIERKLGQSTVINQRRMVLENKAVELSRSRESV